MLRLNWLKRRSLERLAANTERHEAELRSLLNARARKGQKRAKGWRQREARIADLRMLIRASRGLLAHEGWDRTAIATRTNAEHTSAT